MTQHIALYGSRGVGKTTLAANISAALVEAGFSVLLVGSDLDGDSCSLLCGFAMPGVLAQIRSQAAITLESVIHTGFKGISCVELGRSECSGADTAAEVSRALIELKRIHVFDKINPDFVLYDVSADSSGAALHAVFSQADICRLFIVTTADFKSLQATNDAFGFLERHNDGNNELIPMGGLILNGISSSFEEAFVNDFAYRTVARIIGKVPHSQVVTQCELYGKTVIEFSPKSNQSFYYRRLANHIVDATGTLYSGNLPQAMSVERLRAWSIEWADRIYALENGLVSDGAAI